MISNSVGYSLIEDLQDIWNVGEKLTELYCEDAGKLIELNKKKDTVPKSVSEPIKKHSLKILLVLYFTKNKTVKFKDYVTIKGTTFFCNGQTFRA